MHRRVAPADYSAQRELHILFFPVKFCPSLRPEIVAYPQANPVPSSRLSPHLGSPLSAGMGAVIGVIKGEEEKIDLPSI